MSFAMDESLEAASRRAADLFVAIHRGLEDRRVDPGTTRDEARRAFSGTIGDEGVGLEAMLRELERDVLPRCMGTPSPRYMGLINSSPLPGGALGDLIVSALNNNAGAFHQSPAFSALEDEVLRALASALGLPPGLSGMFVPGGSYATLQGLLVARRHRYPRWDDEGPQSLERRPVIYSSESSHFSVSRSARALGVGRKGCVAVRTTGRGSLDPDDLARRIAADRAAGAEPFAVVATAGTTGTGAIDPIARIAEVCERERLWLHVDACYGGAALLLEELRPRFAGIERADSLSVDPHKWFFVPMTAGVVFTRHADAEAAAFDTDAATYIPGDGAVDPFLRGFPTSRRASGATTWMALRAHGVDAVRTAVRTDVALVRLLERLLASSGFRVLGEGELSIANARFEPRGVAKEHLDALQKEVAQEAVATGRTWFATTRHAGETWLRFNVVNIHAREEHIREVAAVVTAAAERARRRLVDLRTSYDAVAGEYARRIAGELAGKPFDRALLDRFAERVRGRGRVCDLGCGPGHVARYLRERGADAFGLDFSERMLDEARSLHPDVPFEQGDFLALRARAGEWAGAVAFYSVIHVPRERLGEAFREAARAIAPGGPLLVSFHLGRDVVHRDEWWGMKVSVGSPGTELEFAL